MSFRGFLNLRRFLCKPTIGTRFKGDFLELSLPLNLVVFVDSFESLKLARKTLTKVGVCMHIPVL